MPSETDVSLKAMSGTDQMIAVETGVGGVLLSAVDSTRMQVFGTYTKRGDKHLGLTKFWSL